MDETADLHSRSRPTEVLPVTPAGAAGTADAAGVAAEGAEHRAADPEHAATDPGAYTADDDGVGEMRSDRTSLARGVLGASSNVVAMVAVQAATAVAFIALAARSEVHPFGAWIGVYSAALAVGGVVDFGTSSLRTRELAQGSGIDSFVVWLRRRTMYQVPAAVAVGVVASFATGGLVSTTTCLLLASQVVTYNLAYGAMAGVRALRTSFQAELCLFGGNVILAVVALAWPRGSLLTAAAAAATLSWLATAALSGWLLRGRVGAKKATAPRNPWLGSSSFGAAAMATSVSGFMVAVLAWTAGADEAALIGAVGRWAQPITLLAAAYASYTFPRAAAARSDRAAVSQLVSLVGFVALGSTAALVMIVLAPWLVSTLLSDEYRDGVAVLRLLVLAAVPILVGQPLLSFLQARGLDRSVGRMHLATAFLSYPVMALASLWLGAAAFPIVSFIGSTYLAAWAGMHVWRMWHRHSSKLLWSVGAVDLPPALRSLAAMSVGVDEASVRRDDEWAPREGEWVPRADGWPSL